MYQGLLELTVKKDVLFIIGDWNAKVWSQEIPGITGKFDLGVQNEAGQRLIESHHSKHLLPTTPEKTLHMDIIRWSILKSDWLHSLQPKREKLDTVCKYRLGADCGSDHELIAKFSLKLKKVWKTSRPFRYNLNQIPYDYTVEVTNRFKGIDLIDRVPEELWTEVCDIV